MDGVVSFLKYCPACMEELGKTKRILVMIGGFWAEKQTPDFLNMKP
jgi:hypothetical protein